MKASILQTCTFDEAARGKCILMIVVPDATVIVHVQIVRRSDIYAHIGARCGARPLIPETSRIEHEALGEGMLETGAPFWALLYSS